mgnify:FL=1
MIFSSHILSEVEAIASRVIIINRGKIVADEPIKELRHLAEEEVQLTVEFEKEGFVTEKMQEWEGVKSWKFIQPPLL